MLAPKIVTETEFKIDKEIPIPSGAGRSGANPKYPFAALEVGDSFLVPDKSQGSMSSTAQHWQKRLGHKYTTRREGSGTRLWRIA